MTSSLADYVNMISMGTRDAEVLRSDQVQLEKVRIVTTVQQNPVVGYLGKSANPDYQPLKLPRRPKWTKEMTAAELDMNEKSSFLEWRRDIALMEEANELKAITPFEKNIEVWRQLWRVIERSQLVIQIVDARNPYFFASEDLEKYIEEQGGQYLMLLNKSDFLSLELREHWNQYLKEKNIEHIFFSAKDETIKLEEYLKSVDEDIEAQVATEVDSDFMSQLKHEITKEEKNDAEFKEADSSGVISLLDTTKVYSRDELLVLLRTLSMQRCGEPNTKDGRHTIGMVGYPNVGKSSIINVLFGAKKVGVAAQPGKTKHFQTLNINSQICLCDCPGLVFPSFASSKAEMYTCGVLPIDHMRDYRNPVDLVIQRIKKEVLEKIYHIALPPKYTASQFLSVYANTKGYVTGRALPDEAKCARIVLKDYVNGKIVYNSLRPDYDKKIHGDINQGSELDLMTGGIGEEIEEDKEEFTEEDILEQCKRN